MTRSLMTDNNGEETDAERMVAAFNEIDINDLSELVTELFVEMVEAERDE